MQQTVSYNSATMAVEAAVTGVSTTEKTLVMTTDGKFSQKSQLTAYLNVTNIEDAVSIYIRYYFTPDFGTTWIPIQTRSLSTGELKDLPGYSLIDSSTYTPGSDAYSACDNVDMPATTGFKITGQASAGSTGAHIQVWAFVRDN